MSLDWNKLSTLSYNESEALLLKSRSSRIIRTGILTKLIAVSKLRESLCAMARYSTKLHWGLLMRTRCYPTEAGRGPGTAVYLLLVGSSWNSMCYEAGRCHRPGRAGVPPLIWSCGIKGNDRFVDQFCKNSIRRLYLTLRTTGLYNSTLNYIKLYRDP